jgi:integrase
MKCTRGEQNLTKVHFVRFVGGAGEQEVLMKGCRPLREDEVRLISQSFGGTYARRDRALFMLGVKSGFRTSELLSLRVGDVYQHGRVVERVSVPRRHMKDRTEGRSVVLHAEAAAALQRWLEERAASQRLDPAAPLFQSRKGGDRPISRQHAYAILCAAYDSNELSGKLGTHCMRKTFADRIYQRLQQIWSKRNAPSAIAILIVR